jgi:hypothetical protein
VASSRADVGAILSVGDLERWGAFSLGLNGPSSQISDNAQINGDVGISNNNTIALGSHATINGDVYYGRFFGLRRNSGAAVNGSVFAGQGSFLHDEATSALNLSWAAGALAPTQNLSMINLSGSSNLTLSGVPGETVVLTLGLLRMSGNSSLTLQGSATTTYVINVNRGFSLTDAAQIVLSGGLDWNDVIFNVRGRGADVVIGGNTIFQGILLATRRTVQLRDSAIIRGETIADRLIAQGNTQITHPPVVSP